MESTPGQSKSAFGAGESVNSPSSPPLSDIDASPAAASLQDVDWSNEAQAAYRQGRFDACVELLQKLKLSRQQQPEKELLSTDPETSPDATEHESVDNEDDDDDDDDDDDVLQSCLELNLCLARYKLKELDLPRLVESLEVLYRRLASSSIPKLPPHYPRAIGVKMDSDVDAAEHPVLLYDLALAYFFQLQFVPAEQLLKKLHRHPFPSSTGSGTGSGSGSGSGSKSSPIASVNPVNEDFLRKYVIPLLTLVAMALGKPAEAQQYLSEQESSMGPHVSRNNSNEHILLRAQALLLAKQFKTFKGDLRSTGMDQSGTLAFEFFRANCEYLRGAYKKSMKLLNNALNNHANGVGKRASSGASSVADQPVFINAPAFYENNQGCLHLMQNKPNLAVHHLNRAIEKADSSLAQKPQLMSRDDFLLQDGRLHTCYNLGVALLQVGGRSQHAYHALIMARPLYQMKPLFWLHLAECCIQWNEKDKENFETLKKTPGAKDGPNPGPYLKVLGHGSQRKLLLADEVFVDSTSLSSSSAAASAGTSEPLQLKHAVLMLRNASMLLAKEQEARSSSSSSSSSPSRRRRRASSITSSVDTSATATATATAAAAAANAKLTQLKADILLKQSYVALKVDDPYEARKFAQELLDLCTSVADQQALPAHYVTLAHLYFGKALVLMDCISEAVDHFEPPKTLPTAGGEQQQQQQPMATRAVFAFNTALVHLLRDELDRAKITLDSLWLKRAEHNIAPKVLLARLYVLLKLGKVHECSELVKKNCQLKRINL